MADAQVAHVSVKIPPFIPTDPALWFGMLEGSFTASNITAERTKFGYAAGALDPRYAIEVKDIVTSPPDNPYTALKEALIKRLSKSQESKTIQLLEHEELGDRKPSQFLRHLRDLGGNTITEDLIRTVWLRRLPASLQAVLATQADTALDRVAELADKVAEMTRQQTPQIQQIQAVQDSGYAEVSLKLAQLALEFREQTASLRSEIASLRAGYRREPASGGHDSRSRGRSRSRSRPRPAGGICWYHFRYGQEAKKCESPCTYPGNDHGGR